MTAPSRGHRADGQLLYFDHAASAPRRPEVFEAMAPFAHGVVGNPTGSHRAARAARLALDDAREEIAVLTGSLPGGVVFTGAGRSGTRSWRTKAEAVISVIPCSGRFAIRKSS